MIIINLKTYINILYYYHKFYYNLINFCNIISMTFLTNLNSNFIKRYKRNVLNEYNDYYL